MASVRFTDRWVQSTSLTPATGRAEFVDGLCPGLHLRVTKRGVRTFSALFRHNGKLVRRTIGHYPLVSVAKARSAALDLFREAQAPADSGVIRSLDEPPLSYEQLVEDYTEKHIKVHARSWENIRAGLRQPCMEPFLKRQAAEIRRRDIIDLIDGIVADGKPHAAVSQLQRLKAMFNWAVARDLLQRNPCDGLKPPVRTTERDRILTDAEIAAVWYATAELPAPYGAMYRMFLLTGQRRSEVSTMQWHEISNRVWTIPREKVKKDRQHAVPLTKTALATLAKLPVFGEQAYVFSTTGGDRPSSNFNKVKRELDRLSGTSGWTIHDLRRTVRSKLAELRVPEVVARKVLNHETGKVDRIYNRHDYLSEKREALAKWEKHLLALTKR